MEASSILFGSKGVSRASIHSYMCETQRDTVSSNSRFQTVLFQQYSANISIGMVHCDDTTVTGRARAAATDPRMATATVLGITFDIILKGQLDCDASALLHTAPHATTHTTPRDRVCDH